MDTAAIPILKRAVEMDAKQQYTLALVLYQEGLQMLLNSLRDINEKSKREHLRTKANEYMDRAEKLKKMIDEQRALGQYREHLKIEAGSTGNGYASLFGRFLDHTVSSINVDDPYIRAPHQCKNFVRVCELAVNKCNSLKEITLTTTRDQDRPKDQAIRLEQLRQSLEERSVKLNTVYSDTLHDRQISLSNGWIIKIGRGLDYFKKSEGDFVLGSFDLELRPCLETTVDIFHQNHVKKD